MSRFVIPVIAIVLLALVTAFAMLRPSAAAQEATPDIAIEPGISYGEADGQAPPSWIATSVRSVMSPRTSQVWPIAWDWTVA